LEEFCIHKITTISCSITIKYKLQMSLNDPLFRLVNTLPCGSDDRLQHINGILTEEQPKLWGEKGQTLSKMSENN